MMYQTIGKLINEGKTPKSILYLSFDHPLLKMCNIHDVIHVYKKNVAIENDLFCFFDEIQYSDDWNNWLKIIYDTFPNISIMATGSASPILEEKVKESGLGRWTTIHVPTLSFFEYCRLLHLDEPMLLPVLNQHNFFY